MMRAKLVQKIGWMLIILVTLIPVIRWFQLNAPDFYFDSYTIFTALGSLTGIIALCLYALNFILSTRLKIFDTFFGGLNKAYIAHHLVGGIALIFMLVHPLFLAVRHLPEAAHTAALFLIPQFGPDADWAENFGSIALFLTIILLVITFYVKLPYNRWLKTHRLLGVAFLFAGLHVYFISSDTSQDLFMRVYMLGIIFAGLVAYGYYTLFGRILVRRKSMQVSNVELLGLKTVRITFEPTHPRIPIDFSPGQFVFVRFKQKGINHEFHPFSITSKEGDHALSIIVKELGDFTASLRNLEPGTFAEIEGAFGTFGKNIKLSDNQTWIAGGIGITPFLSLAKSLKPNQTVELFYIIQAFDDMVEFSELLDIAINSQGKFQLYLYPFNVHQKFVSGQYIVDNSTGDIRDKQILLCGPPPMMRSMRAQLRAAGVAESRIHSEEFALL